MNTFPRLRLRVGNPEKLTIYLAAQLHNLIPDQGMEADIENIQAVLPNALIRMEPILAAVRNFETGVLDHYNALQHCTLVYLLSNEASTQHPCSTLADRLFCLNRAMHAIDLFHRVQMPEVFFISHGLATVLGNANYGNRIVVFQNVTVGRVGENRPTIGSHVVLYPGATITGNSVVGDGSVIAAGTVVHNTFIPPHSIVSQGPLGLLFTPCRRDYSLLYFNH